MSRPSPEQLDFARRLLAHEGDVGQTQADRDSTPAGRVYDKLQAHFAVLLGDAGVSALFLRSARLTGSAIEGAAKLRESLNAQRPAATIDSAATLFATFFALITTFIGERLTAELLRRAWPTLGEKTPTKESTK